MDAINYLISRPYLLTSVVLYHYCGYVYKNIEQTTLSINNFFKDHLHIDLNYRGCPFTHECEYYKPLHEY